MSAGRIAALVRKSLNPRNPYLLMVLIGPFIYAAIFQLVFGIWKDDPRIAVYEEEGTAVQARLMESGAVKLLRADTPQELYRLVEGKKADVGVLLPLEDLQQLEAGETASLEVYVWGESLAKNRAIAMAALTDALRSLNPEAPRVSFRLTRLGEERALSPMEMTLPFFVILVIILGAYLLPASFLVSEKEKRTMEALLATPLNLVEIMVAFGLVGIFLSLVMGILLVLLTVGFAQPALLFLIFFLGSLLAAEWGLLMGLASPDQTSMVAYMKALNLFIIGPALFVIFPRWPQWIARIFPTYYIANPVFRITIYGEGWREVGWQIMALAGFVLLFLVPLALFTARQGKAFRSRVLSLGG